MPRLGLFTLQEPLAVADDWVYLIDHSVQIGSVKVCVIVGLRLSELPSPARPLRQEDVRLRALLPTEHSNGEMVAGQLEQTARRTGIPREIVSDHGSDVKKGSELFAARHAQTQVVYDAAHHGAGVLKRRFEADARWADLITRTRPGERLVGSTEVLESVFGKWKTLERQESNSGITSFLLSLGAMLGTWTTSRLQEALKQTPVKQVKSWCRTYLPPSVQSQRRLAFHRSSL